MVYIRRARLFIMLAKKVMQIARILGKTSKREEQKLIGLKDGVRGAKEWARRNDKSPEEGRRRFHKGVKGKDKGSHVGWVKRSATQQILMYVELNTCG
jgi:hypothetical protein